MQMVSQPDTLMVVLTQIRVHLQMEQGSSPLLCSTIKHHLPTNTASRYNTRFCVCSLIIMLIFTTYNYNNESTYI